ncbi:MAG: hypothetical protein E7628_07605 [Ruminococcaceae bacterium]|nr:hypothetical protein [Oscillospiraceae bacterium]
MKKFIINTVSALLLCVFLAANALAAPLPFSDVKEDAWYYADVRTAYRSGLINGKTYTTFAPDANLTYAEAVKLAACLNQFFTEGTVTLSNGDPWYQTYVDYCAEREIITHEYEWNENATRGGYMEIFAAALSDEILNPINDIQDNAIPDVGAEHPQAEGIYKLYRAGILQGSDAETHVCNPDSSIRRSEVSAILARILDSDRRIRFDMIIDIPFEVVTAPVSAYPDKMVGRVEFSAEALGNDVGYSWQVYDLGTLDWVEIGTEGTLVVEYNFDASDAILMYRCIVTDGDEEFITENVSVYPPMIVGEIVKSPADRQQLTSVILSCSDLSLKEAKALADLADGAKFVLKDSDAGVRLLESLAELGGEAVVSSESSRGMKFVRLISVGEDKTEVVKLIDRHTGCGLTVAKGIIKETLPMIGMYMTPAAAEKFVSALVLAGAEAVIE